MSRDIVTYGLALGTGFLGAFAPLRSPKSGRRQNLKLLFTQAFGRK